MPYFGKLKNVKDRGHRGVQDRNRHEDLQSDFRWCRSPTPIISYLNEMGDNRITLITCIANQPSLRLCVQAVEIR